MTRWQWLNSRKWGAGAPLAALSVTRRLLKGQRAKGEPAGAWPRSPGLPESACTPVTRPGAAASCAGRADIL